MMSSSEPTVMRGLLALECPIGADAGALPGLSQVVAGELADLIGRDLARLEPAVVQSDLVLAGAHFDPAEVLRPGWPLHRRLHELLQRARQGRQPRIVAFGHDGEGRIPQPLQADPDLRGGGLRVLPWLLSGDAAVIGTVRDSLEARLLDEGMAAADTALFAQEQLQLPIEHARYLTLHDLLAMTALQYENQSLDGFWLLLETALLRPQHTAMLDAPPEPHAHYADGVLHLRLPSAESWHARCAAHIIDPDRLERGYALDEMRTRQFAAIARAHGLEVCFDYQDAPAA